MTIDPTLPHYEVRVFLTETKAGTAFDERFATLVGATPGPHYSTDLNAVVGALNALGWWWHLSHLSAEVIPTSPVRGMEGLLSNGSAYDREGRPVTYRSSFAREQPALCLCTAWVMAVYDLPSAYHVVASAIQQALGKEPWSTREMMAYHRASEANRQRQIKDYEERHGRSRESS